MQSDDALERMLRDFGASVAYPSADGEAARPDVASRARARIEALGTRPSAVGRRRFGFGIRPMRRGLVLAVAALLVLAAIAAAVGLGLPGLRIIFGDVPSQRPSPSTAAPSRSPLAPLGADLGLGTVLPLAEVEKLAGFDLVLPPDPKIGQPDVAYLAGQRAVLVWAGRPGLPATDIEGMGLLLSQFRGHVETGYYEKVLGSGTKLTPVTVNGASGYSISGDPHFFYYVDANGKFVDDTHRTVGDTLIWSTGEMTYRLESGLDMAAAIRLAETLE
jgi:hypothetical protein